MVSVFCYQRDYARIARGGYAGTRQFRIPDPYGDMTRHYEPDTGQYREPTARARPGRDDDAPWDRKDSGKGMTLRSLRAVGGSNRRSHVMKIAHRLQPNNIMDQPIHV